MGRRDVRAAPRLRVARPTGLGNGEIAPPSDDKGKGKGKDKDKGKDKAKDKGKSRKPGDWDCPKCGTMNFASRGECFKCGATKPRDGGRDDRGDRGRSRSRGRY